MNAFRRLLRAPVATMAAIVCTGALSASAGPFTHIVVFGDSIVDTGNVYIASGGVVPVSPPYFSGHFSDGPVWVETLASGLGLAADAAPFLVGGMNYAFGGARTGSGLSPPDQLTQLDIWDPGVGLADPDALYVLAAGSNDMRDARDAYPIVPDDHDARAAAAQDAIDRIGDALDFLSTRGAKHVLLPNIADLGLTPEAALLGLAAASSDASSEFNSRLPGLVASAEANLGLQIDILDIAGFQAAVTADALGNGGGVYGITNVLLPCGGFSFPAGPACAQSLYSDGLHPTAAAHQQIGLAALRLYDVTVAVPAPPVLAPAAWLLLAVGVLVGRRRAAVA